MKILKKFSFAIIFFFVLLSSLFTVITIVKAVQLNPSSGNIGIGVTQNINITATPPANSSTVQVRLNFSGPGQITGYTSNSSGSFLTLFGACPGSTSFTSTSVCADISKTSGNLVTGDSLGSFTFSTNAAGTINITKASNNGYVVGSGSSASLQPDTSGGATYNVVSNGGVLPNTAIGDNLILVVIGGVCILLGIKLIYDKKKLNS